jgi:ubiquinone/menaquinone biosynthesis C-methylase UbiE
MTAQKKQNVGDNYVLPTGADDAGRLDLIQTVYGPISFRGLEAAGISQAKRAADIGCGTGTISRWMAQRMGPDGQVDAIDISKDQIDIAKARPVEQDSGEIDFAEGSAYEPPLSANTYDVVFCRLVLCHLKEPSRAVAQMKSLLKPGGRLVVVDMDLRTAFTMPHSEDYEAWQHSAPIKHDIKIGVDYEIGRRLHELLHAAKLQTIFLAVDQPIYNRAPEKLLWEKTWHNALPALVSAGTMPQEWGDKILAGMAKHTASEDVWVAMVKMFAAVGQKASD